ncbi:hypothetical protein SUDANB132_05902 [Streptomyces sp. enrichment culture]
MRSPGRAGAVPARAPAGRPSGAGGDGGGRGAGVAPGVRGPSSGRGGVVPAWMPAGGPPGVGGGGRRRCRRAPGDVCAAAGTRGVYGVRRGAGTAHGSPRPAFRTRLALLQPLPQPVEAAPQDARHLHLRDAHGTRDLRLAALPVEPQVEHPAVALRQPPHQGGQGHRVDDPAERGVLRSGRPGSRLPPAVPGRLVEGTRPALVHRPQRRQHPLPVQPGVLGDLLRGGGAAAEPLFQLLDGLEDASARLLQRPRQPDHRRTVAQVPAQLTGDLGQRVRQEGVAPRGVVAVDGLDQSHGGDLREIVELLAVVPEPAGDAPRHGQQQPDEVVPQGGPARSRGLRGELAQQRVELLRGRLGHGAPAHPAVVGCWCGGHGPLGVSGLLGTACGSGRPPVTGEPCRRCPRRFRIHPPLPPRNPFCAACGKTLRPAGDVPPRPVAPPGRPVCAVASRPVRAGTDPGVAGHPSTLMRSRAMSSPGFGAWRMRRSAMASRSVGSARSRRPARAAVASSMSTPGASTSPSV